MPYIPYVHVFTNPPGKVLCACARVCACACVSVRVCACMFAPVHVCVCARECVHVVRLCINAAARLHSCLNFTCCTECSANAIPTLQSWGQGLLACMAASCSCAPLPLAQPGLLLPAAGGQGLGGKAEQGGASSPSLLTLNNEYLKTPPPENLNRSPEK